MAKQQKELDKKEREMDAENDGGYDGDGDAESCDDESEDDESLSFESPATSKFVTPKSVKFDMKDAKAGPIRWTSPNGSPQTAIRIPRTSTRSSFRKSARQTGCIEQVTESMINKKKVKPDVGVEWLIESIFERNDDGSNA